MRIHVHDKSTCHLVCSDGAMVFAHKQLLHDCTVNPELVHMSCFYVPLWCASKTNPSAGNTNKPMWAAREAYLSAGNTGKPLNLVLRRVLTTVSTLSTALNPTTGLAITCNAQLLMGIT